MQCIYSITACKSTCHCSIHLQNHCRFCVLGRYNVHGDNFLKKECCVHLVHYLWKTERTLAIIQQGQIFIMHEYIHKPLLYCITPYKYKVEAKHHHVHLHVKIYSYMTPCTYLYYILCSCSPNTIHSKLQKYKI